MACLCWNATHGMERVSRVWDRIVQIYAEVAEKVDDARSGLGSSEFRDS